MRRAIRSHRHQPREAGGGGSELAKIALSACRPASLGQVQLVSLRLTHRRRWRQRRRGEWPHPSLAALRAAITRWLLSLAFRLSRGCSWGRNRRRLPERRVVPSDGSALALALPQLGVGKRRIGDLGQASRAHRSLQLWALSSSTAPPECAASWPAPQEARLVSCGTTKTARSACCRTSGLGASTSRSRFAPSAAPLGCRCRSFPPSARRAPLRACALTALA